MNYKNINFTSVLGLLWFQLKYYVSLNSYFIERLITFKQHYNHTGSNAVISAGIKAECALEADIHPRNRQQIKHYNRWQFTYYK